MRGRVRPKFPLLLVVAIIALPLAFTTISTQAVEAAGVNFPVTGGLDCNG